VSSTFCVVQYDAFKLSKEKVVELVIESIDYAFCDDATRARVKEVIQCRVRKNESDIPKVVESS